jgi:hypothetical protein
LLIEIFDVNQQRGEVLTGTLPCADFENTILFQHYVYVLYPDSPVLVDGGYVTQFDKNIVVIEEVSECSIKYSFSKVDGEERWYWKEKKDLK